MTSRRTCHHAPPTRSYMIGWFHLSGRVSIGIEQITNWENTSRRMEGVPFRQRSPPGNILDPQDYFTAERLKAGRTVRFVEFCGNTYPQVLKCWLYWISIQ